MNESVNAAAESLRDDMAAFLREIVAIPSPCGQEGNVIERLRTTMLDFGYDEVRVDKMGNLLGRIGAGPRLIAIDGHCDTVGVGNPDTWEVDPFEGDYRDGVIYGRGAVDQKGGLTSALFAGKILKEIGLPEEISLLVVASVYEEDVEGVCWQHLVMDEKLAPEVVLLTEPTNLEIKIGQRGRMEMRVATSGRSCHGSAPERGENAIYKIAPIIREIEELHNHLENPSILGKGSITVTDVRSTAPSLCAVADSATIHLDRRLSEGETLESAVREVRGLPSVRAAGAEVTIPRYKIKTHTGYERLVEAYYPTWLMERDNPFVQLAVETHEAQFGEGVELGVWQFSTNGVATKGMYGMPTIGFGPGKEEYAHTPSDQVRVDDLVKAAKFYVAFVLSQVAESSAALGDIGPTGTR
jgi:putative selenium metabolism hydrolase